MRYHTQLFPQILPLKTTATFSLSENRWAATLKYADGRTAYVASLEPDFDVGQQLIRLQFVLRHPDDEADAANLASPVRNWHDVHTVRIVPSDFMNESWTISDKSLGLLLPVTIANAAVSKISEGKYQLDAIDLSIDLNHSRCSRQVVPIAAPLPILRILHLPHSVGP